MTALRGYWRTARQYAASPKGGCDLRGYAKAAALFLATVLAAMLIVGWLT